MTKLTTISQLPKYIEKWLNEIWINDLGIKRKKTGEMMDEKIKAMQKDTKKVVKDESKLLKMDKKNDKKLDKCGMMEKKKMKK